MAYDISGKKTVKTNEGSIIITVIVIIYPQQFQTSRGILYGLVTINACYKITFA